MYGLEPGGRSSKRCSVTSSARLRLNDEKNPVCIDPGLPVRGESADCAELPVPSLVFSVCARSGGALRFFAWRMARREATAALPSLAPGWLRPGPLIKLSTLPLKWTRKD